MRKKVKQKKQLSFDMLVESQKNVTKNAEKAAAVTLVMALFLSFGNSLAPNIKYVNPGFSSDSKFVVAHAGGALEVDGKMKSYLNSVEGFNKYYADGTKMFEYDFVFSEEGKLVGSHNYEYLSSHSAKDRITYEEFLKTKIAGEFEGMTEEKLLDLIEENPDCKFILDTKEKNPIKVYERIINLANERNVDISSSILPFVSSKEMLKKINKLYDFKEIMFTNYKESYSTRDLLNIIDSCDKIKYVHIFPIDFFMLDINEINKRGIRVFAHMDESNKTRTALQYGCTGIFSDDISENEFRKKHYDFMVSKLSISHESVLVPKKSEEENPLEL